MTDESEEPLLPEPFYRVARIAILVIGVLILIVLLLQFAGVVELG